MASSATYFLCVGLFMAILFAMGYVFLVAIRFIDEGREELRDRYTDRSWKPVAIDLVFLPVWLVSEVVCIVVKLLLALVIVFAAWQTATAVRDWWHAGSKSNR